MGADPTEPAIVVNIPRPILAEIETRYWAPIEACAQPESFMFDPTLFDSPAMHPALFPDHGVVHVRDVARTAAKLAGTLIGSLLKHRKVERVDFVRDIAVMLTYLHDIGMVATTPSGRKVHPQFAAQTAMADEFDDLAEALWDSDAGGLRSRLCGIHEVRRFRVSPKIVLREVLALSLCHSKSAIPGPVLDDRHGLRRMMIRGTFTDLSVQALAEKDSLQHLPWDPIDATPAAAAYADVSEDAFAWMIDTCTEVREFVDDVIDAIRILRASDALRQRGTALCTSGGFEICADITTTRALYGLRNRDRTRAAILSIDNPISSAESNVRYATLDPSGVLRIAFYRGFSQLGSASAGFSTMVTTTAHVIADIEADAVGSFSSDATPFVQRRRIELVSLLGNDEFVPAVAAATRHHYVHLNDRIDVVPPDPDAPVPSDARWLADGERLDPSDRRSFQLFDEMGRRGLNVSKIDRQVALSKAVVVRVRSGTVVLQPHTIATVVLVPLSAGLVVHPTGGYEVQPLHPWLPVGVTGVVRGGERNAAVVADTDVEIVVIDADAYLRHWFRPYELEECRDLIEQWRTVDDHC